MKNNLPPWKGTFMAELKTASRIHYTLLPSHLYHQVTKTEYTTAPIHTDHRIFEIHINLNKFKTGRHYPEVKNSIYSDPDFTSKVTNMIQDILQDKPNETPEDILDLILFNTQTIA